MKYFNNNEKYIKQSNILKDIICNEIGVSRPEAFSDKTRLRNAVLSRQIFCSIFYEHTSISTSELGSIVYDNTMSMDHATVLHSIGTIKNQSDTNKELKKTVERINDRYMRKTLRINKMSNMFLHHQVMNERPKSRIKQRIIY